MTPTPNASFLVTLVLDLPDWDGLMVSGKPLEGKVQQGMLLQDSAQRSALVLNLEFLSPRDIRTGEVTIEMERTDPSPIRPGAVLTAVPPTD
jgi:hypothetical protein